MNLQAGDTTEALKYCFEQEVCLFVLGFNVSLTIFQSYCDGEQEASNLIKDINCIQSQFIVYRLL